jgi:hypothetical protein
MVIPVYANTKIKGKKHLSGDSLASPHSAHVQNK